MARQTGMRARKTGNKEKAAYGLLFTYPTNQHETSYAEMIFVIRRKLLRSEQPLTEAVDAEKE